MASSPQKPKKESRVVFPLCFLFLLLMLGKRAQPLPFSLVSLIRERGQKCGDDDGVDDVGVYSDRKKDSKKGERKK